MRRHVMSFGIAVLIVLVIGSGLELRTRVAQRQSRRNLTVELGSVAGYESDRATYERLLEAAHARSVGESSARTLLVVPRHDAEAYRAAAYRLMIGDAIRQGRQDVALHLEQRRALGAQARGE